MGIMSAVAVTPGVSQESGLDPVVIDAIEMLRAGVDEGVIVQWLESTDRRPTDVGRQDLIALAEAGASELLMTALLKGVEARSATPAATPRPIDQEAPPAAEPIPPSPKAIAGAVESVIQLRAKQAFVDEDEPDSPRPQPWWVYLYLDGELVAWTKPSTKGEPVESSMMIESGRRELRVVLQRYEDLRGGWHHESLSVPTLVSFEVSPGTPVEIEVEMKRIWGLWRDRKDGGPFSYVIRQGAQVLAEHGGTGGNPDRWLPVCEDVEANFADSQTVPKRFRSAMGRCIRWSELWTGVGQSTVRSDILAALAEYDYQPPAR